MMILYERGLFKLSDPVSLHIPEFADLQVYAGMDDNGNMITEPPDHPMTVRELMNHTGGLTYGLFSQSPVDDMYNAAAVLDPASNLQDMIDKLAKIPCVSSLARSGITACRSMCKAIWSKNYRGSASLTSSKKIFSNHSEWSILTFLCLPTRQIV